MMRGLVEKVTSSIGAMLANKGSLGNDFEAIRQHVLLRISEVPVGQFPFYHLYIDKLFPDAYFEALWEQMREFKVPEKMQARTQDNDAFVNRRYPLARSSELTIRQFRAIWEDSEVKLALFKKFYVNPTPAMMNEIEIHKKEFEFVFSEPGRFQNIHVDIPPKYMSFVFYFPKEPLSDEDELKNATVLYDSDLNPVHNARFRKNSVCIFVPHFHSYHGFSTTIERDVLVMFMMNATDQKHWHEVLKLKKDRAPDFDATLHLIEQKLARNPLIEYGTDPKDLEAARKACRINAPRGRVMLDLE